MFWKSIQMNEKRRIIVWAFIAAVMLSTGKTKGDFIFGEPFPVPNVNSPGADAHPRISADDLSLFFVSGPPWVSGKEIDYDLWVSKRASRDDSWGEPQNLGPTVNSSVDDSGPSISNDGLSLYFYSLRSGGYGAQDIWVTTRATLEDEWGEPKNLGPNVNSSVGDAVPTVSADGLALYFCSNRTGGLSRDDFWVARRPTVDDDWGPAENLGSPICSQYGEWMSDISADGSMFFFSDWFPLRPSGFGWGDIFMSRRSAISDPWKEPVHFEAPINSPSDEGGISISADASTIYFHSTRPGGSGDYDIWQAPILPVVDLNGDGIVDAADMCIMVDHWGTDEPLCDIGPTPLGDGIVDMQDLIVLDDHLEFEDSRLIAYWRLDEQGWRIAYDSVGDNDIILNGDPMWQPAQGMINGALQFDGIDDYMSTPFVLDPTADPFSVFAWIKGGEAGRVIISQAASLCDWLATGPTGKLTTTLPHPSFPALESDGVITDGVWHHIGLVCNAASTILYVDGAEVAGNNIPPILPAQGGLYIGAGKDLEPGTYWSGMMDDIRIYGAALSAEEIEALAR